MQAKKSDLNMDAQYIKGVGPKRAETLKRLGINKVVDLLYYLPRRHEDRSRIIPIKEVMPGESHTVQGIIRRHGVWKTKKGALVYEMAVSDGTGSIHAAWFNQPYMKNCFRVGQRIILYGKVERFRYLQITQPDYEIIGDGDADDEMTHMGRIVPIYPLTQDMTQRYLRSLIYRAIETYSPSVDETLPTDMRARNRLADLRFAVRNIHFPETQDSLRMAYRRLVFEEFFLLEAALALAKKRRKGSAEGIKHALDKISLEEFEGMLPFKMTDGQKNAVRQIESDMADPRPMNRLLEGEVGSGKTVVAMYALLLTVRNGFQGIFMAPTEILARQHYMTLSGFFLPLEVKVGMLTSGMGPDAKRETRQALASGDVHIVIGTHALIEENVVFDKAGLIVIDEQHKFGVSQRSALMTRNKNADCLIMTATPIPRTLAMTVYGDLDISVIRELPGGRKPVSTYWVEEERRDRVYAFVKEELRKGRQCYMVVPRIEDDEAGELASAKALYEHLSDEIFTDFKVGLLHGRMKSGEKEAVMKGFRKGSINLMVSTVLVEVGIDVPNASVMVVENADRFGLAQLHQLRGRIGRGEYDSYCILISDPRNEEARRRLDAFQMLQDGFELAEEDLSIRGQGQLLGTRQHGLPELRFGDLVADREILETARAEAFRMVDGDPSLTDSRHAAIRRSLVERFKGKTGFLGIG